MDKCYEDLKLDITEKNVKSGVIEDGCKLSIGFIVMMRIGYASVYYHDQDSELSKQ